MHRKMYIFISMVLSVLLLLSGCANYSTTSVKDYGVFFNQNKFLTTSSLKVSPQSIDENAVVNNYLFEYGETFLDSSVQLYLDVTYTESGYLYEIERLKSIKESTYIYDKSPVEICPYEQITYDTENFNYPAYVTYFYENLIYEYAITLEQENRIVYLYLEYFPEQKISFDKAFLPRQNTGDSSLIDKDQ